MSAISRAQRTSSSRRPSSKAGLTRAHSRNGSRTVFARGGTRSFSTRRPSGPSRRRAFPHPSLFGWRARSRGQVSVQCRGSLPASPCLLVAFIREWSAMRSTVSSGPSVRKAACSPSPRFPSKNSPAPSRTATRLRAAHARCLALMFPSGRTSCALRRAARIAPRSRILSPRLSRAVASIRSSPTGAISRFRARGPSGGSVRSKSSRFSCM